MYDKRAYLRHVKNVNRGLRARTEILHLIDRVGTASSQQIARLVNLKPVTIRYHLRNLSRGGAVRYSRSNKGWRTIPRTQTQLDEFLDTKK